MLTTSGSIDGPQICANLMQPQPLAIVLGARLAAPATDPLPTVNATTGSYTACGGTLAACASAAAPASGGCVCDQDGDGKPGATLSVANAPVFSDLDKAYVALRATVTLQGQVFSSEEIDGTVEATLEQVILGCHRASQGASDCSLGDLGLIQAVAPVITQSDASMNACNQSLFTARRVPAGTDCATLAGVLAAP
jgi:hypothetical protein